jgi:hypothetical protein
MAGTRLKNVNWNPGNDEGNAESWERVIVAVLLDLRDELNALRNEFVGLNRIVGCGNAIDIPNILRRIDNNTKKQTHKRKKA